MPRLLGEKENEAIVSEAPIEYSHVVVTMTGALAVIDGCRRRYRVSDRHHVVCYVRAQGVAVDLYLAENEDMGHAHLETAPPDVIVKFAEISAMVAAWVAGTTSCLPPSTFVEPPAAPR